MRDLAKTLLGADREQVIFDRCKPGSYHETVRRVMQGWPLEEALLDVEIPKETVDEGEIRCACGSHRVQSHVLQTRSADEGGKSLCALFRCMSLSHPPPASIFCRCFDCSRTWRM